MITAQFCAAVASGDYSVHHKKFLRWLTWSIHFRPTIQPQAIPSITYMQLSFYCCTIKKVDSAGNLMKRLGQRYVQYINRAYKRSCTLWEGRFRSSVIQQQKYLFICQKYIEMNPVRAGMVEHPGEYHWSSYQVNGQGNKSDLISCHSLCHNLGRTDTERQVAYRDLFRHELEPGEIDKIRKSTNGNLVFATKRFEEEISAMLGRRVTPGKAGRPRIETITNKPK